MRSVNGESALREHLLYLLCGGGAHTDFESVFANIPPEFQGKRAEHGNHTLWQLLWHMRICQWDILRFCLDEYHVSPEFPEGLWPKSAEPESPQQWSAELVSFRTDAEAMRNLVAKDTNDLLSPIPHGDGQTLLREALLVADHNAYHLGQAVMLRRCLGIWD